MSNRLRNMTFRQAAAAVLTVATLAAAPAGAQERAISNLKIIAPANPGGGWDQTARAMQEAMEKEGIASGVQVVNVPGAGGTIGLAQFVAGGRREANSLLVGGLVMVGAILTNNSPVTLDQVTPIARLTGEYEAIVVPSASKYQTLTDLVAAFRDNPQSVSWGGGSAGGTDHILIGMIARQAGIDPAGVNYIPFSGGGEALAAILGNHVTAGVSSYSEFEAQIKAGSLRALAISSPQRVAGVDVPTLIEQGINIELTNWRAVMAPPNLNDRQKQALAGAVDRMAKSQAWQQTLKQRNWIDLYMPAAEFAGFLKTDQARVEEVLADIGLVQQ